MENTKIQFETYNQNSKSLLEKAVTDLLNDMNARGLGAIIWDLATTGFHYIPTVTLKSSKGNDIKVKRITGLYAYSDKVYMIEEGEKKANINHLYNHDTEVKPSVVTLSPAMASEILGNPENETGFLTSASLDEWLTIADCYFEALDEK